MLRDRLYERVDKMLENGLVQELLDFHEEYNKSRLKKNEWVYQPIKLTHFTCENSEEPLRPPETEAVSPEPRDHAISTSPYYIQI